MAVANAGAAATRAAGEVAGCASVLVRPLLSSSSSPVSVAPRSSWAACFAISLSFLLRSRTRYSESLAAGAALPAMAAWMRSESGPRNSTAHCCSSSCWIITCSNECRMLKLTEPTSGDPRARSTIWGRDRDTTGDAMSVQSAAPRRSLCGHCVVTRSTPLRVPLGQAPPGGLSRLKLAGQRRQASRASRKAGQTPKQWRTTMDKRPPHVHQHACVADSTKTVFVLLQTSSSAATRRD